MSNIRKVIVTGSTGMLGNSVIEEFTKRQCFKVYGISRNINKDNSRLYTHISIDLTDFNLLEQVIDEIKPDIIIHCAAIVNVDDCEDDKEYAYNLHVKATQILASYKPGSTKFIYVSTDSVFDGNLGNYSEIDKTNPLNYYAQSKLQGEKIVLDINSNAIVIRTNIYGFHIPKSKSLVEWAIENFSKQKDINGFTDVYFNPVYVGELAGVILYLCTHVEYNGILNVGCKEHISKYDFLRKLAQQFLYSERLVHKISVDEIKFNALRPKITTLNIDTLKKLYYKVPSIEVGMKNMADDKKEI
ncbi:dTDP-4-dehydrorhamnose reductase family protein [Clostridium sp.]|jgi:dTDP-4-dehydrorhamnose reductase|uniref:dTDP-4-dehydrorhamnose reductase family protein n=1 Tax=Clostridium sp. TaxID=1506 RepID=UPI003EEBF028